eukprot:TRINITY_DN9837_c1_g2_i4.p1 TRINITY_DN9837_c1_g2~~TRINITY_DN9837_c1_g2_i4.p1  ORF type:complete len:379 (+),score=89.55 TRINITY_DN9837_c1_g2_i4:59-1195(+)
MDVVQVQMVQPEDEILHVDEDCSLQYVATKNERLIYKWRIRNYTEQNHPRSTPFYSFMEETALANAVRWKVRLIPADIDVSGNEVVSVQVFINADPSLAFKVTMSIGILDINKQETYKVGSSIYFLGRDKVADGGGTSPSFKGILLPCQELMNNRQSLLINNSLTLLVKLRFSLTRTSLDGSDNNFLNPPSSLSNDLSEALKSSDFTDMTIVCDKKEFHCHKFILAARSEVFAAMLRHEFLEKQNSRVDVKEIDPETMELLLYYIYTGQVQDFNKVSVVDLFKAADRYRLEDLKHICEEELIERVEASNAADILSLAHKYNAQPLKSFALAMISRNVEEVMRTPGWKELIQTDQTLLMEAFDSLARYNTELKNKLGSN